MIEGNIWEILLDSWILFGTCKLYNLYTWEVGVLGCFILKTICEAPDFKGASLRGISAEHGIGQCKPHYLHLSKAESAMNLMKMLGYAFVMCKKTGFQTFVSDVSGNEVGWGTCHSKAKFAVLAILALFDPGDLMDIS